MCRTLILALVALSACGGKTEYSQLNNRQLLDIYLKTTYANQSEDTVTFHRWDVDETGNVKPEITVYDKTEVRDEVHRLYNALLDDEPGEFRHQMICDIIMINVMDDLTNNLMKNK